MELTADRYYKPSGAVPLLGTISMQLFGAVAAFVLGAVYALANYYSPHFLLSGLAVLAFGAGVGFAVQMGAKIGKVRSPGFVMLLGTATGLLAMYFAWVFFIYLYLPKGPFPQGVWLWNPRGILAMMQFFADTGIWSIKSWTPTGWVLYAFWAAEALFVVGLSLVVSVANDDPYCDHCNVWTKKEKDIASFALTDSQRLKDDLEQDRYEVLDTLSRQPKEPRDCLKATLYTCPQCEDSDFLTVNHTRIVTDKEGNETTQETAVVKHLWVSRDLTEHLRELGHAPDIAEPAPAGEIALEKGMEK